MSDSNHQAKPDNGNRSVVIFWVVVIVLILVFANWNVIRGFFSSTVQGRTTCIDVTSYDHNWDNDMLCTRPNGTHFYTNYAGATQYE